jgi:hypothetical protein
MTSAMVGLLLSQPAQPVVAAGDGLHGVIVLFVQIGALRTENMFPYKHLRLIDLSLGALFENG